MKITYNGFPYLFGSVLALVIVTLFTAPANWISLYVALLLLLSPLVLLLNRRHGYILYSFVMIGSILLLLGLINLIETPHYLWIMYVWFPLLWWPISAIVGARAKSALFASVASLSIIAYYLILNIFMHAFPWVLFPAFALLWWPLSIAFAKQPKLYSIVSFILITCFFIAVNIVTTPTTLWAIYPIFVATWWPISLYFGKRPLLFSIISVLSLSIFLVTVNHITSPQTIWAIYPIFVALWWPLSLYFFAYKKKTVR